MRSALVALVVLLALPGSASAAAESSPGVRLEANIAETGVISARAVDGHLYVSSLSGISIFDISAPRTPVRVGRLDLPNVQNEDVDVGSGILLVTDDPSGGRGILHVIDVSDPARPRPLSTYSTWARGLEGFFDAQRVPRRGGIGHTATCIDACRYAWLAGSSAGIDIVDLRDPARPRFVRRFKARAASGAAGTHDVQVDATGLAWVAGGGGTAAYDVSDPVRPRLVHRTSPRGARPPLNNGIHHNSVRLPGGVLAITEEDFRSGCVGAGSLQTWKIGDGGTLRPLDRFGVERDRAARLLCSAHYFDARDGLIAQGFYEQGVRLLDASRPRRLRQVGYYVPPRGMVWGALFAPTDPAGETVYALDHARGIDVLSVDRTALERVRREPDRQAGPPARSFSLFVADGRDALRPRSPTTMYFEVDGPARGPVDIEITLPPELVNVRPRGRIRFDPVTRVLTLRLRRLPGSPRLFDVPARVASWAVPGTPLETIGYVRGPRDVLPLDDRGVDRGIVATRAQAAAATAGAFCRLRPRGTLR